MRFPATASFQGPDTRFSFDGRLFAINTGPGAKRLIATQTADLCNPNGLRTRKVSPTGP